jgi:hypothetical protein
MARQNQSPYDGVVGLLDGLSEEALDALRRRESLVVGDRGFEELALRDIDGVPIVTRGDASLGEPAWSVTTAGLALWQALVSQEAES